MYIANGVRLDRCMASVAACKRQAKINQARHRATMSVHVCQLCHVNPPAKGHNYCRPCLPEARKSGVQNI